MNNEYTAVIKQDGEWWIGWIEEHGNLHGNLYATIRQTRRPANNPSACHTESHRTRWKRLDPPTRGTRRSTESEI